MHRIDSIALNPVKVMKRPEATLNKSRVLIGDCICSPSGDRSSTKAAKMATRDLTHDNNKKF